MALSMKPKCLVLRILKYDEETKGGEEARFIADFKVRIPTLKERFLGGGFE